MRGWTDKTVLKVLKILNIVGQWLNSSGIVNHALFKGKLIKIVYIFLNIFVLQVNFSKSCRTKSEYFTGIVNRAVFG